MPRRADVWWLSSKQAWVTEIDRKRYVLAKGRANKQQARVALAAKLRERELLAKVNGAISVAGLAERFLEDAKERHAPSTFQSYRYACDSPPLSDSGGDRIMVPEGGPKDERDWRGRVAA